MDNLYELLGASTGIAGAILLAIKCRFSAWAWPLWIVSGVAWIVYAQATSTYGLLAQQVVFTTINLIGTWRWLIQPIAQKTGVRLAGTPARECSHSNHRQEPVTMNRQELIEHIAEATGETKAASGRFLDAFINTVQTAVASGDKVSLVGFGSFETVSTKARQGRNPATGDVLTIDATVRPKFSPGSNFKALVKETLEK